MRIIFATGNAGKMREIREIMADMDMEICSMKEAGISLDIEENGTTFEENAQIKAKAVAACTKDIVLADDSGGRLFKQGAGRIFGAVSGRGYFL